jgi:O-antigen ligase
MQALALIAGIVALVWAAVLFVRGGLLGTSLLVLLAGTCFSFDFLRVPVGAVPLTVDRILWVVLLVQYLIWRRARRADPKPIGKAEIVLCAFVGLLVLSTFAADWRADGCEPVARLIIFYLMPVGLYWVVRQSALSKTGVLAIFGCLAAFGVYLAVTTIAETCGVWWLVFPKYIYTTTSSTELEFIGRGRGPLLNPVGNGILLAVCLSAALMWWPRFNRPGRLMLIALSLLIITAIGCTLTRSAWLGGAVGLAVLVGLAIPAKWRVPVLGGGVLVAVLLVATQWQHIVAFKRDRDLTAEHTAESVAMRPILATVTWKMFLDRPLFGCGLFQYPDQSRYYLSDRSVALPLEKARGCLPHNVLFSYLTETGLIGLALFLTLIGFWIRDAWRLWRSPTAPLWARQQGLLMLVLLGIYFANGMFHDTSVVPMGNMFLFFTAGVTAALRPLVIPAAATTRSAQRDRLPSSGVPSPQPVAPPVPVPPGPAVPPLHPGQSPATT